MAILWLLMVQFIADHFSMPVMQQACAVKLFTFRDATLIMALIGHFVWFTGVSKFKSLGVGGYWCVLLGVLLVQPSCSLWPEGGMGARADVMLGVGRLGQGIGMSRVPQVLFMGVFTHLYWLYTFQDIGMAIS